MMGWSFDVMWGKHITSTITLIINNIVKLFFWFGLNRFGTPKSKSIVLYK